MARIAPLVVEFRLNAYAPSVESAFTDSFERWLAKPGTFKGDTDSDDWSFSFELRDGKGRCEGRWLELSLVPSKFVLTWKTRATEGAKTRITVETQQEGDSSLVRLTHEGFRSEASRLAHERLWPELLKRIEDAQRAFLSQGTAPSKTEPAPKLEPGFWSWGSVLVRIFKPEAGGLDAERLDPKTGQFVRDVRMISEIYFKPDTSTRIERLDEKQFHSRVEALRGKLRK